MPHLDGSQELPSLTPSQPLISHPNGYFLSLPQARELQLLTNLNDPPDHWLRAGSGLSQTHGSSPSSPQIPVASSSPAPARPGTGCESAAEHRGSPQPAETGDNVAEGVTRTVGVGISTNDPQPVGASQLQAFPSSSSPSPGSVSAGVSQRNVSLTLASDSSALVPRASSDVAELSFASDAAASPPACRPSVDACVLEPTLNDDKIPPSFGKLVAAVPGDKLQHHADEAAEIHNLFSQLSMSGLPPISSLIAEAHPDAVGKVDIIGASEVVKSLLEAPYSNGPLSLAVHRVDRTVLVDPLDIHRLYQDRPPTAPRGAAYGSPYPPKPPTAPHKVPQPAGSDFAGPSSSAGASAGMDLPAGLLGVMQEAVQAGSLHLAQRVLQPAKKDSQKARSRKLFSKFMAHSMVSGGEAGTDSSADTTTLSQVTSCPADGEPLGAYDAVPTDQRGQFGNGAPAHHVVSSVPHAQLANTTTSSSSSSSVSAAAQSDAAIANPAPGSYSASAIAKWKVQHEELMSGKYEPKLSTGSGTATARTQGAKKSLAWQEGTQSKDVRSSSVAAAAARGNAVGADEERAQKEYSSGAGSVPAGRGDGAVKQYVLSGGGGAVLAGDARRDASLHDALSDKTSVSIQSQGSGRVLSAKREDAASSVQCSVPLKPRPVAVGSFGMVHPTSGVTSSSTIYNMGWQWPFKRHVEWVFKDLRMLLGTNMPIFGCGKYPAVSLKLVDVAQRIDVLTGIDYWLDNLMCGVPDLVMCFHLNGVVKGYDWHKTMDLPDLDSSSFNPELISDVANNIYNFLYRTTAQEGHTYWLFKDRDEDMVRIYDLTAICFRKPGRSTADNPYTIPVAMLLYRTAKYWMASQRSRMTMSCMHDVFALLKNTVRLLQGDVTCPEVQVSALYLLSTICIDRRDTAIGDDSPLLLISEPEFEADETGAEPSNLSPPPSPLFDDGGGGANLSDGDDARARSGDDSDELAAGRRARLWEDGQPYGRSRSRSFSSVNTVVQSIDVNFFLKGNYSKQERDKHESPPLPQASKRIQNTIELIEEGLLLLTEWQGKVAHTLSSFAMDSNVAPPRSADAAGHPGTGCGVPDTPATAQSPSACHASDCTKQACTGCVDSADHAARSGASVEQQQQQRGSLAELLRQHALQIEDTSPPASRRKGKKKKRPASKRAATPTDSPPSANEPPRAISPCAPLHAPGNDNGSTPGAHEEDAAISRPAAADAQPSGETPAAYRPGRSASDPAGARQGSALPERSSGEIVIDTARRTSLVPGGGAGSSMRREDLDDLPGARARLESETVDAEHAAAAADPYIDLRLDFRGAVHEGVCGCRQPWYMHAVLLLCNQAGLALHGLASHSLGAGHAGRALRYLNTASACFLVGERLTKYLCAHRCQEAGKITSFTANMVAVMALKVRAFDELITEKNSSEPRLSFERHAEEYCARTCGHRLTSWVKLVLPNRSCFHPTVLTNDEEVLMKEIYDLCTCLIQAAKQQDIPGSLVKTCVRFAAQSCVQIAVKELQKIHFFIAEAFSVAKDNLQRFALNISAAKAVIASLELPTLKMVTDEIESIGEHDVAIGYRLNMVNCLHVMAIVEYPSLFLRLRHQHQLLELADVQIRYAKSLALLDTQTGLHEKNVSSFQLSKTTDPELHSTLLFNNLIIQVVKAYFMFTHMIQGYVALDAEPVFKLLHSAEVKIKKASGLADVYARAGHRLQLATCLIQLGRAALFLKVLHIDGSASHGRKKVFEFKQNKLQWDLKCAHMYVETCEDIVLRSAIVLLKLDFIQLCISAEMDNSLPYTYQLHHDVLATFITLITALEIYLRSFAEGKTDGAMYLLERLGPVDGRAVFAFFFALPHMRRECQHDEGGSVVCGVGRMVTYLRSSLQNLVRLQMQCKQLPASRADWKVFYRRALTELSAADPGDKDARLSHLSSLLALLEDIRTALEGVEALH